jgi:flagellar protein FliS
MEATKIKDFQTKIVNADKGQLVIICYEMLIAEIDYAIMQLESNKEDEFSKVMARAHKILRELSDNLDLQYNISADLMAIYIYINKQFVEASTSKKIEPLNEAKTILNTLLDGWKEANKLEGNNKPLIQNAQKVYAGLTYGKGTLNETVYDGSTGRGFKA